VERKRLRQTSWVSGDCSGPAVEPLPPLVRLHLVIDGSGSMCDSIDAVNDGIAMLAVALRQDAITADSIDITLISFGGTVELLAGPTLARDFRPRSYTWSG
jgi:uncharacterized protein YegL